MNRFYDNPTWAPIEGWSGEYEISNDGRIKSLPKVRRINQGVRTTKERISIYTPGTSGNHLSASLRRAGYRKLVPIHRLVALAFIPRVAGKNIVNHKNGVRFDNRVENLEWVTHSENLIHCWRVLGAKKPCVTGANNPRAILNETQVSQIRNEYLTMTGPELAKKYGVSKGCISGVVSGRTWQTRCNSQLRQA